MPHIADSGLGDCKGWWELNIGKCNLEGCYILWMACHQVAYQKSRTSGGKLSRTNIYPKLFFCDTIIYKALHEIVISLFYTRWKVFSFIWPNFTNFYSFASSWKYHTLRNTASHLPQNWCGGPILQGDLNILAPTSIRKHRLILALRLLCLSACCQPLRKTW